MKYIVIARGKITLSTESPTEATNAYNKLQRSGNFPSMWDDEGNEIEMLEARVQALEKEFNSLNDAKLAVLEALVGNKWLISSPYKFQRLNQHGHATNEGMIEIKVIEWVLPKGEKA